MELDFSLRWNRGRARFVPDRPVLDPERYAVRPIEERTAFAFCDKEHYAGRGAPTRLCVGLFERGGGETLVGVATFAVLMQPAAARRWCGQDARYVPELNRLCLRDGPFNEESWFVRRCQRIVRERLPEARCLISYADPMPRRNAAGRLVKFGHIGTFTKALGWRYCGTSAPRKLILDERGMVLSERSLSKIRNQERGHRYAEKQLVEAGAPTRSEDECPREYVRRALACGAFQTLHHHGNLVYVTALADDEDTAARLAPALPYLTKQDLGLA